jgi:hypothetical protein
MLQKREQAPRYGSNEEEKKLNVVHHCVFPEESPDNSLSGPKHIVD